MASHEDFREAADEGQEWEIDFEGGPTRITSLSWIAYRATEDDEATVSEL